MQKRIKNFSANKYDARSCKKTRVKLVVDSVRSCSYNYSLTYFCASTVDLKEFVAKSKKLAYEEFMIYF